MSTMTPERPDTSDRHKQPKETFHLPAALQTALAEYVASHRPRTTKSDVIRLALEEYLTEKGYWSPETTDDD